MLSKEDKSTTGPSNDQSGYVDGIFYLTNEELVKIIKASGYRWTRDGYVNLQGGIDPTANEYRSILLSGGTITQLVLVSLNSNIAAQIKHLDISFNSELSLVGPDEELEKLKNLRFLEFKYSHRKEVPRLISVLPVVETILLGGNIISVLPAWVTEKSGMKVGKEKRPVFQIK